MFDKIKHFFEVDLWQMTEERLSFFKSFLVKLMRVNVLSFKKFYKNKCYLHASALTFYSLLSIVPLIALLFGIARGFGYEALLKEQIKAQFENQQEVLTWIMGFAEALLRDVQSGFIAGVGICLLLWTFIKLCGNIEKSFNLIWGVKKTRTLTRKFIDYLAVLFVAPLLFIISNSFTIFVSGGMATYIEKYLPSAASAFLINLTVHVLSLAFIWLLFMFIYVFMPNTKVKLKSGFIAGVVAGTIYIALGWVYIRFQVGVARYSAVYGSFAAMPLFLIWIQLSWVIVLFGAEVSYSVQNVQNYGFFRDIGLVCNSFKKLLALRIANLCVKSFFNEEKGWNDDRLSEHLKIPLNLVRRVTEKLVRANVLAKVVGEKKGEFYHPAISTDRLTVAKVLSMWDEEGIKDIKIATSSQLKKISSCLTEFEKQLEESKSNILIRDV